MAPRKAVILMAGLGSRLARPHPKSLTPLGNGETILSRALRILRSFDLTVCGVVGFKADLVMEAAPEILFAYNPNYDTTNTSKSLLAGLRNIQGEDVLWLNGDVVFEPNIIARMLAAPTSAVAVNSARVGDEEVKYNLTPSGYIRSISKRVPDALGEALGINLVRAAELDAFKACLDRVGENDYFERAMELLIEERGEVFRPVDIGDGVCVEVDFQEDLQRAQGMLAQRTE